MQDELVATVERARQEWNGYRRHEEYEAELAANHRTLVELVRCGRDDADRVLQIFGSRVRVTMMLLEEAWTAMRAQVGPTAQAVMDLAKHVDEAVHPATAWPAVIKPCRSPSRDESGAEANGWQRAAASRCDVTEELLDFEPLSGANFGTPDRSWRIALEQRWLALDTEIIGSPPNLNDFADAAENPPEQIVSQVEQAFLQVGDRLQFTSAGIESDDAPSSAPYLGIEFDPGRLRVRRDGIAEWVKLDGITLFNILSRLVSERECFVSQEVLHDNWIDLGGRTDDPSGNLISDHIADLRSAIRPLRLKIKNKTKVGYRIEEIETENKFDMCQMRD